MTGPAAGGEFTMRWREAGECFPEASFGGERGDSERARWRVLLLLSRNDLQRFLHLKKMQRSWDEGWEAWLVTATGSASVWWRVDDWAGTSTQVIQQEVVGGHDGSKSAPQREKSLWRENKAWCKTCGGNLRPDLRCNRKSVSIPHHHLPLQAAPTRRVVVSLRRSTEEFPVTS